MKDSVTAELVKVAPPASVGGLSLFSIPLNDWVIIGTAFYTVLIILDKLFPGVVARSASWVVHKIKGLFL